MPFLGVIDILVDKRERQQELCPTLSLSRTSLLGLWPCRGLINTIQDLHRRCQRPKKTGNTKLGVSHLARCCTWSTDCCYKSFESLVSCGWLLLFVPFVFVHCDNTWVQCAIVSDVSLAVSLVRFFAISLLILISPLLSRLWVMICPCEDQPASSPPIVPHPSQGRAPRSKYFKFFGHSF